MTFQNAILLETIKLQQVSYAVAPFYVWNQVHCIATFLSYILGFLVCFFLILYISWCFRFHCNSFFQSDVIENRSEFKFEEKILKSWEL